MPDTIRSPNGTTIKIIVPDSSIPAAYHRIFAQTTDLIEQHNPQICVHIGLAVDRDFFAVENSAPKEGYHDVPDIDRRVFTRAENKKTFGKSADSLSTSLDLESAASAWQDACSHMSMPTKEAEGSKGKVKGKQAKRMVDVRLSDDVGTYVCGFMYYASMLEMQKRTAKRDVVFLHVPRLKGSEEMGIGVDVARELISSLVGEWERKL